MLSTKVRGACFVSLIGHLLLHRERVLVAPFFLLGRRVLAELDLGQQFLGRSARLLRAQHRVRTEQDALARAAALPLHEIPAQHLAAAAPQAQSEADLLVIPQRVLGLAVRQGERRDGLGGDPRFHPCCLAQGWGSGEGCRPRCPMADSGIILERKKA